MKAYKASIIHVKCKQANQQLKVKSHKNYINHNKKPLKRNIDNNMKETSYKTPGIIIENKTNINLDVSAELSITDEVQNYKITIRK